MFFELCRGKIITGIVLAVFITNGSLSTLQLQQLGRGHVRDCLVRMSNATPSETITYDSQRMGMDRFCVDYYAATLPHPVHFSTATDQAPQWWILDLDSPAEIGPPTLYRDHARYQLDSIYPSNPVSGLTWDLYRLAQ